MEMLPYALDPQIDGLNMYSQFKTLAEMPGMDLIYRRWVNLDESRSVTYPERHSSHGGLQHLPEEQRKEIMGIKSVKSHLCCSDSSRLFRFYQDTAVDIHQIIEEIKTGLAESSKRILEPIRRGDWHGAATEILPPAVGGIRCIQSNDRPKGVVWVEWDKPWNGAPVDKFSVYCVNTGSEYITLQTNLVLDRYFTEGDEVVFLIRPIMGQFKGEFSGVGRCVA